MAVINPYILRLLGGGKNVNPKILRKLEGRMHGTSKRLTEEKEQAAPKREIKERLDEIEMESRTASPTRKDYLEDRKEDMLEEYWEQSGTETRRINEELSPDEQYKTAESPQQLDRPEEVWTKYDQEIDEGKISPLEDAEPHLDRIHNELIDQGKLSLKEDYDPDLAPTGPEGIQPRRQTKTQLEDLYERRQKGPLPETSDMTLEELQRKTNRPIEKLEPGEASGLTRKEPTDQIDVLGRNREAALRATIDELPPHLQTPENIRILAKEIIQEDVSDKAVGQVFGKSREAHPGVLDPDTEDFNIRSLEDMFVEGVKADTPQKRAVQQVRKEAAQAAEKSGRSKIIKDKFTGENRYIPKTLRAFVKDPKNVGNIRTNRQQLERILKRPDQAPLEAVQEKLTGPMKPEAAARQVIEGKDQKQRLMELMWQRLGKELKEQPEGLNDAISAEELLMQIFKGMIGK